MGCLLEGNRFKLLCESFTGYRHQRAVSMRWWIWIVYHQRAVGNSGPWIAYPPDGSKMHHRLPT